MRVSIKGRFATGLPAVRCTPEMRDEVVKIAEKEGTSLGEIQRAALSLFLSEYATDCSNSATELSREELAS